MKKIQVICCFSVLVMSLFFCFRVHAAYVLPYPSFMPGNKLYQISRLVEKIKKYWSWGTLAQTKYQLSLSDKYLVEAKTLFEYHQYLLGATALERSNEAFSTLPILVTASKKEGKDIAATRNTITEAAMEHIRVLGSMKETIPDSFTWVPEKEKATELSLHDMVKTAITLRETVVYNVNAL